MKRFFFIAAIFLLMAAAGCDRYPSQSLIVNSKDALVQTAEGTLCGYIEDGIYTFKGIQYAKAERFMPPEDPDSWEGVQTALYYGHQCYQSPRMTWEDDCEAFLYQWDDGTQSDDCLYLNVWTKGINDGKKRPVMVWLHGGGFAMGASSELPFYDGANLAKKDVVLVSINHRLNVLGYMDLSDFGEKYKYSGVAGIMDMVKALEWVNRNIAAFGGDPDNVTIFGQSGGGGKVCTLLAMPSAQGLFSKAIVESGSILEALPQKWARRIGAATVRRLGINPSRIDEIGKVPYETLLAAYDAAVAEVRTEAEQDGALPENLLNQLIFGTRPVVDGDILPEQPGSPAAMALSKDIPVIIGTTYHEFTRDQEDPIFKPLALAQAADRTAAGCAPVYLYQFTWESPVLDGAFGSTHCIEIPFVFDNVDLHRTFTGGGADAVALGHRVSRLWTNFAKTGVPSADGMPVWEPYPHTMILNIESKLE